MDCYAQPRVSPQGNLLRKIDYLWRFFGTAMSFSLFGIGGLILSILIFPIMRIWVRDRDRRVVIAQNTVQRAFGLFVCFMHRMGVIDLTINGAEALRGDRGTLVIANHPTLIDVVLIMSQMARTQCVVKHKNWANPYMRGVLSATDYVRNDGQPEQLIHSCAELLKRGENLIIFPEGSRTVPGERRRFQRGYATIALEAEAPIRLVTVKCRPTTLTKAEKWYQIPASRPHFALNVHDRVIPDAEMYALPRPLSTRRLSALIERRFEEILGNGTA